jgi:SecD/SecF fusion protein
MMSGMRRSMLMMAVLLGLVIASAAVVIVKPTVLGLDLRGGVEVVLQGQATPEAEVNDEAIDRAIEVIRNRVDAFGVTEPEIQKQGSDQIVVALPGVEDPALVDRLIRPAQLTMFDFENSVVRPEGDGSAYEAVKRAQRTDPDTDRGKEAFYLFSADRELLVGPEFDRQAFNDQVAGLPGGRPAGSTVETVPAGLLVVKEETPLPDSDVTQTTWYVLQNDPGLTGGDITRSFVQTNTQLGSPEPVVVMEFTGEGREKFQDITAAVAQRGIVEQQLQRFAIVLDGEVISTPTVDYAEYPAGIDGRNGAQIQGDFSQGEARDLANQLNSGAIPIELIRVSEKSVSATLGKQSLRQGLTAALIGLLLVIIFLVGYYRVLGVIAALALLMYAVMLFAVIELVPVTLTLPGIAGIILTIGVASDANVVIFERIREEARAGRTPRAAILNGYKKGITAIIDANVVTLATAVIIFLFATAGVRGFAFTLFIGVILSFFTAVFATRAMVGVLADTRFLKEEKYMGLKQRQPRWTIDFVGRWKLWMAISFIPIAIGMVWIGVNGLELGLDFRSGTRMAVAFTEQPSENQIREIFTKRGFEAKVQATTETIEGQDVQGFQITTDVLTPSEVTAVTRDLRAINGFDEITSRDLVGPTFGRQIIRNAVIAVILSFLVIIGYLWIRFEYKLALPALLTVVHDLLLSISIYAFTGRELTSATVAALLTILGYSLYDVVIVFDRIRENVPILRGWRYRDVVNRSMQEMFSRSLITMFTTLIPIMALFFFGGQTLKDFSFALMVGIFAGGASSIVIAGPLAALWKERDDPKRQAPTKAEKRAQLVTTGDSDIADLDVLTRAEMMLDAELAGEMDRTQIAAGIESAVDQDDGTDDEDDGQDEPPSDDEGPGAAAPGDEEPAPEPRAPAAKGATPRPDSGRVRRHQKVRRRRRR